MMNTFALWKLILSFTVNFVYVEAQYTQVGGQVYYNGAARLPGSSSICEGDGMAQYHPKNMPPGGTSEYFWTGCRHLSAWGSCTPCDGYSCVYHGPSPTCEEVWMSVFCPGDGYRYACSSWKQCPAGQYLIDCQRCADYQCVPCLNNHYCPGDNKYYPCKVCSSGLTQSTPCTAFGDTQCKPCTTCIGGFTSQKCTSFKDTVCHSCPQNSTPYVANAMTYLDCVCKAGYYGRVYNANYSTCAPCPPNKFCPGHVTKAPTKVCLCSGAQ